MLNHDDIIAAANIFKKATKSTSEDYAHGDVAGEEDFSGQLIGRLKGKFEEFETPSVRWSVGATVTEAADGPLLPTVRFSGRQTGKIVEEPATGADMVFVLDIRAGDYVSSKGVLVQAKRLKRGAKLPSAIATDLRSQCTDMLNLTPASFVFLYSPTDVAVLSATIVEGSKRDNLHALEQWRDSDMIFFIDFAKCWVGDSYISALSWMLDDCPINRDIELHLGRKRWMPLPAIAATVRKVWTNRREDYGRPIPIAEFIDECGRHSSLLLYERSRIDTFGRTHCSLSAIVKATEDAEPPDDDEAVPL